MNVKPRFQGAEIIKTDLSKDPQDPRNLYEIRIHPQKLGAGVCWNGVVTPSKMADKAYFNLETNAHQKNCNFFKYFMLSIVRDSTLPELDKKAFCAAIEVNEPHYMEIIHQKYQTQKQQHVIAVKRYCWLI
jgi:hypothetical protein